MNLLKNQRSRAMLGEAAIRRLLEAALSYSQAEQTEVLFFATRSALTRFANNEIHQNVAEDDTSLQVRAVFGKKIGVASVNNVTEEAARRAVDKAIAIARLAQDNPDFISLPAPQPIRRREAWAERTAALTPEERARAVGAICRRAQEQGLVASGAFSVAAQELAIANSLGVFAYHPMTEAELNTVVMSATSSGYAARLAKDAGALDAEAVGNEAIAKALRAQNPVDLEPGDYEVILEEYAVSDLLDFFAYEGFGALAVQEGRSFLSGKMGQQLMGPNITIWDDGLDPSGLPLPFDFEGVPKQRVTLIEGGVARGACYDTTTAAKEGKESTGHALPAGETFGPVPTNLFLQPGTATKEAMVASIERGIWVTRFWYTRTVHPLTVHVTGMTRDGTFLIERGEITRPIKNLRFTQSYLEAMNQVRAIGREPKLERTMFSVNSVPALHIGKFTFTGVTQY